MHRWCHWHQRQIYYQCHWYRWSAPPSPPVVIPSSRFTLTVVISAANLLPPLMTSPFNLPNDKHGYRTGPPGYIGWWIDTLESTPGLLKRLQLRALVRYFKLLRSPGIDFASLFSLAGRYGNPIPTRFLAPIDCYKITALWSSVARWPWPPPKNSKQGV